jgi:D-sedoheptulose 7-phosphate isomerase
MDTYPSIKFNHAGEFFADYASTLYAAAKTVDLEKVQMAAEIIQSSFDKKGVLYGCGNGGSAAISNHMTCDVMKGVQTDTSISPRIVSLSSNVEIITAISNDISYEEVFSYQLNSIVKSEDVLMTISSSGNSENVVKAINVAKQIGIPVISLTGFNGGRSAKMADVNIHVDCDNYGIIEDLHQSIMHVLAQYLRMQAMPSELIPQRKF